MYIHLSVQILFLKETLIDSGQSNIFDISKIFLRRKDSSLFGSWDSASFLLTFISERNIVFCFRLYLISLTLVLVLVRFRIIEAGRHSWNLKSTEPRLRSRNLDLKLNLELDFHCPLNSFWVLFCRFSEFYLTWILSIQSHIFSIGFFSDIPY